jgi:hypothetical protein
MGLAPVIGILYAQGINVLAPPLDELFDFTRTQMTTAVTEAPFGVLVDIGAENGLTLTLDEHLTVVDIAQ